MIIELGLKFWLPHQHNLNELLRGSLQIGEHTEMLKGFDRHVLRFIDNQRHIAALFILFDQDLMQTVDRVRHILGEHLNAKFATERF